MSIFSSIKNWLKKTFGGSSSSSSSARRARTVSNYGGGGSRSYSSTSRYLPKEPIESKQQRMEREAKERKAKQDATTKALASTIDKKTKDVESKLNTTSAKATSGVDRAIRKMGERAKSAPPDPKIAQAQKSREDATKALRSLEKVASKATTKPERRMTGTIEGAKIEAERHPVATMAARKAVNGALFGAPDLVGKLSAKGDAKELEETYRRTAEEHPWIAGGSEIAGSLVGFGLTGGLSKAVAGNALNKVGGKEAAERLFENQVAKLAGSEVVKKAARREAMMAARQGAIKAVDEEVVKKFALDRARRILNGVAEDMAINATTGLVYDLTSSATDSNSLGEFGKNMLINAGMNAVVGGLQPIGGALIRTNRGALEAAGRIFADEAGDAVARNADEVIERAAVNAVEDNADNVARTAEPPRMAEEVAPPPMQEEVPPPPMREEVAPPKEEPKPNTTERKQAQKNTTESKSKALRKELDELRAERDRIIKDIEDKHGTRNPDFKSLSEEERSTVAAQKKRLQEIKKREDVASKEFNEAIRTESASEPTPTSTRAEREAERDAVNKEYLALKKKISDAEKSGDLYDGIDADRIRLDELQSRRDTLNNSLGTQAKERKTRSDKGKKKAKPEPPTAKTEPEVKAKPEPKVEAPERTYKDVDTKRYVKKADRPLLESRISELRAEKQTLEATGKASDAARIEELGAEISELQRALDLKPNQKVKFEDVNAKQPEPEVKATSEAEPKAQATAKEKPKPEPKEQKQKSAKAESAKKKARDKRAEEAFKEYDKTVKSETNGEYAGNKTVVGTAKTSDAKNERRIISDLTQAIEDAKEGGEIDLKHAHKVKGVAYANELRAKSVEKISKDRGAVEKKLKSLLKEIDEADKIGDTKYVTLQDLSDVYEVENSYMVQGKSVPKKIADVLDQIKDRHGTQNGQGLKMIHTMRMTRSPQYRTQFANRDIAAYAKKMGIDDLESVSKSMKSKTGESLEDRIKAWAKNIDASPEEQEKAYANLQIDIFRHSEPSIMDTINLWRHMFLLSKPTTALNNILGNTLMYAMSGINDRVQYFAEGALKAKYGDAVERTTTLTSKINSDGRKLMSWGAKNASYEDKAFASDINDVVSKAVERIMGNSKWEMNIEKGLDFDYGRDIRAQVKGGLTKIGAKGNKFVGTMLNKPDEWFVEKNYRNALIKYLYANGIDSAEKLAGNPDLLARAEQHATKVAKENTFKSASELVKIIDRFRMSAYRKDSSIAKKIGVMALDANVPFTKVPWNLVKVNAKYSPIGLVWNGGKAMRAASKGDVQALEEAVGELSKGLTGTGLATLGFFLACNDATDDDSWGFIGKADKALKEYNVRDYSFKIGNKNLNLANTGIGTIQFLIGARYAEWANEHGGLPKALKEDPSALISSLAMTFAPISDMSLLDNLVDSAKSFTYGSQNDDWNIVTGIGNVLEQSAGNYAGQFVPSPLRAIARGTTSADLDTSVKKGSSNTARVGNNLVSGIPIANEKVLPHKVDTHGNLINEKKSTKDKIIGESGVLQNLTDPFSTRTINIPKADKVELQVKNEKGESYKPKAFDANKTFQAKIGQGKNAEVYDLTGKEREQAARSVKKSGHDMANNLVYSTRGWFGDSHGERAQQILRDTPEDEEKAREYLYNTPEFKALSDKDKAEFMDALYDTRQGRGRTANHEVYVNIKGGDEGDFRFQNDLEWQQQDKYNEHKLADYGITKGMWADIVEAAQYESHKFTDDGKNQDTINSAKKLKAALLSLDELSPEARVAAYQAYRGKRNGFGWYDWDGVSGSSGYRRSGYRRWRRYGHGGSSKKAKVPTPKTIKASQLVKGEALVSKKSSSSAKATLPQLKRVEAKIDLPTKKKR